jgi:hypothetical protein
MKLDASSQGTTRNLRAWDKTAMKETVRLPKVAEWNGAGSPMNFAQFSGASASIFVADPPVAVTLKWGKTRCGKAMTTTTDKFNRRPFGEWLNRLQRLLKHYETNGFRPIQEEEQFAKWFEIADPGSFGLNTWVERSA